MSVADLMLAGGSVLIVGGGVRSALIWFALRRGEVCPPDRARVGARIYGGLALLGAALLGVALWVGG